MGAALLALSATPVFAQSCPNGGTVAEWISVGWCDMGPMRFNAMSSAQPSRMPLLYTIGAGYVDLTILGSLSDGQNRAPWLAPSYAVYGENDLQLSFSLAGAPVSAVGITRYVGDVWAMPPESNAGWDTNDNYSEISDATGSYSIVWKGFCPYGAGNSPVCVPTTQTVLGPLHMDYSSSELTPLVDPTAPYILWLRTRPGMNYYNGVQYATVTGIQQVTYRFALVPEPSIWALTAIGLVAIAFATRRRARAHGSVPAVAQRRRES